MLLGLGLVLLGLGLGLLGLGLGLLGLGLGLLELGLGLLELGRTWSAVMSLTPASLHALIAWGTGWGRGGA